MEVLFAGMLAAAGALFFAKRLKRDRNETKGHPGDIEVGSTLEADAIINNEQPGWLFKHSTTCPLSSHAIREFMSYMRDNPDQKAGIVIVQSQRAVSNYIADKLGIRHESPQVFLLQKGEVLWTSSHGGIHREAMRSAFQGQ